MKDQSKKSFFWARVKKASASECWEWTGYRDKGYGKFRVTNDEPWEWAHRFSFVLHGRILRRGQCALHKCDNRGCVNPHHLFSGTRADNIRDMDQTGRRRPNPPRGEKAKSAVLTLAEVIEIRRRVSAGEWVSQIAREMGHRYGRVWEVAAGKTWMHLGPIERAREIGTYHPRGPRKIISVLTEGEVMGIRQRLKNGDWVADIAREIKQPYFRVYLIATGKTWAHLGPIAHSHRSKPYHPRKDRGMKRVVGRATSWPPAF